jgi:hypothetical protein
MSLVYTAPLVKQPAAAVPCSTIGSKPHCVFIGGKSEAKNHHFFESSNISHVLNVVSLLVVSVVMCSVQSRSFSMHYLIFSLCCHKMCGT